MRSPDGPIGQILETIMARLKWAGVLQPDRPNYPTHYNAAYSAVLEALQEVAVAPGVASANRPDRALVQPPPPYSGPTPDVTVKPGGPRVAVERDLATLANRQGKSYVPDTWPRLAEGQQVLVVAPDGAHYIMQVWIMKGKQVTFRCLGKIEKTEP